MALIDTPGLATSDTYATLAEANAWNAQYVVLHPADPWATATDPTKEAALKLARTFMDAWPLSWTGAAVDAVQALRWPRSGMLTRNGFAVPTAGATSIPVDLKNAQAEFARQLLSADRTADNSLINKSIVGLTAGSVSLNFAELKMDNSLLVARSVRALNALMAQMPDAVRALLVPSWLLPDSEDERLGQFVFENFS